MQICVWINNRNRLTTTLKLVEYLASVPGAVPIIIDNASTYQPLLEWYRSYTGAIIFSEKNLGSQAPWLLGLDLARGCNYYAVTDSDLDLSSVPTDLLNVLSAGLQKFPRANKAGLSLELDDLPVSRATTQVREWEAHFWEKRLDSQFFDADVDTTFALYRAGTGWGGNGGPAIRTDRPYTARHVPWYMTAETITAEERYYLDHCDRAHSAWAGRIMESLGASA